MSDRQPPIRLTEKEHYDFLHGLQLDAMTGLPCSTVDVDHMSYNDAWLGKVAAGMSGKTHFGWCLPVDHDDHMARHSKIGMDTFLARHLMKKQGTGMDFILGPGVMAVTLLGFSAMQNPTGARSYITNHMEARRFHHSTRENL